MSNRPVGSPASAPTTPADSAKTEFQERLLLVDINRQQLKQTVMLLEDKTGALYLWRHDMQRWRLRLPEASTAIDYQGEKYYPVSAISDVSAIYDPNRLTLMINVRPEAFIETAQTIQASNMPPPVKTGPGGFINYDLFAANSPASTQRAGQFELGYFNRFGVGTSGILANDLGNSTRVTRLDTTWTTDYPDQRQTLHLGDAFSAPGSWGRSVRFGGIQFGTNFGTQPGFLAYPPQSADGQAVLPSTVDVFVNNALVAHQNVPPGPFSISNLPVVTGQGNVQLVVRDLLGREQIVTQPFYAGQTLLRKDLEVYSSELGVVRDNFGINSNDYGSWLGSQTYRRGLSDQLTGEIHGEVMQSQSTVGAGADYLIQQFGVFSSYFAASHGNLGNGNLQLLGLERQGYPWSFGAHTQRATRNFTQIGLVSPQLPAAQLSSYNLSYANNTGGSVGIAYIAQRNRNQADTRIATLSYSTSLGSFGTFSISALRNLAGEANTTIFAILSCSLNPSTSLSVSSQSMRGGSSANGNDFSSTLQRNLPLGEGYGYRLQAHDDGRKEVSYSLQNNVGTYTAETAQYQGSNTSRLDATGGIALLGGDAFLSRSINQSFAVARIPDYPGVRVLADNQPAGRTDASGNALIPGLRAYDANMISIDQRDLPLGAEIGALKLEAVPYFRSGVDVTFPIKRSNGAVLTLLSEDGKPLPVGTAVKVASKDRTYTIGYDGEVYLIDLGPVNKLRATWSDHTCAVEVLYTPGADPLPDLGRFICKGIQP